MTRRLRLLTAFGLVLLTTLPAGADDKDFLRPVGEAVPPNLLIVFGNSQTLTQTISFTGVNTSTFDGDGDSPGSKMGAAKRVVKQFVVENATSYNIGLTSFSHDPNAGSIDIDRKHWVYQALDTDFPDDVFKEVAGTLSRWGPAGEGPCTSKTVPYCGDRSKQFDGITPAVISLPDSKATVVGPFFGSVSSSPAYIYLDGTASDAKKRIRYQIVAGNYGDAFTDGFLTALTRGTHSIEVKKQYQERPTKNDSWPVGASPTPAGHAGEVIVGYRPPVYFSQENFYTKTADPLDPALGDAVGFLNDRNGDSSADFIVKANCSGWEFQTNSDQVPLVKIPRDYFWGEACNPPQDSVPCVKRMMRPQAYIERYDPVTGFSTDDPDNPGYTGLGSRYADGCDPNLMGAVQAGLDVVENNAILTTRNGSQAPIKNLLENIYAYFTEPKHDDFLNGARIDDPNASCRSNAVILIYDNFNGCQNDECSFLKNKILTPLKAMGIPVYVIGFGASASTGVCAGTPGTPPVPPTDACPLVCIAQHSGAKKLNGQPGYFPVTDDVGLRKALLDIASLINEAQKGFVASSVSTAQASGEQVTFLSTFNATSNRSIWSGRVNAYKLDSSGNLQMGFRKIEDPADPFAGATVPAPSNAPTSLMWNAGANLTATPGTGATVPSAVLEPGDVPANGTYEDGSNIATSTIVTTFFPGRKIVFSLPQNLAPPGPSTTLPIPAADAVPEDRFDMVSPGGDPPFTTPPSWWTALRTLLSPQSTPPFALTSPIEDGDALDSIRFIWGDRDPIILAADSEALAAKLYGDAEGDARVMDGVGGLKLGDIFHSSPVLVGRPNDFAYFTSNLNGYKDFLNTYRNRRRVLLVGANDGLLHAFDAGGWNRNPSVCDPGQGCYDLGTGTELFAYAPRSILSIYKGLKDTHGPQTRTIQWSVDGPPTAGDVFIDSSHDGTPTPADRTWHTILIGGMREGSAFEGTSGAKPADSLGSFYALDITQPDALTLDLAGKPITIIPATKNAPRCLNAGADPSCGKDAADATVRSGQPARSWPTVLWEITDTGDQDLAGTAGAGFVDMGESWSKPSLGRVRVCTANCGTDTAELEDRYVAIFGGGFDRQRLNRRGNWIYMVDVETGHVLYRANWGCGINADSSCSPIYFGSIPSEPSSLDGNGDGVIDVVYVGDMKGRMWRIDVTDLRLLSSPAGRFDNKIDVNAGSGKPFLFFEAPQPIAPLTHPFFPVYYRPVVISLGYNIAGKPAVGIAFGTGDRDDITSRVEPLALTFRQRFYYVVDRSNTTTLFEGNLIDIASPTAAALTVAPTNGWFLQLPLGERLNADGLAAGGVVFFPTFNPLAGLSGTNPCANNLPECGLAQGTARLYRVFYSTGNPYLGADRGQTQQLGGFLSEPVYFQSRDQEGNIIYTTENTVKNEDAPGAKKTTVKSWKERSRRP